MEDWQKQLIQDELDKLFTHPHFVKKNRLREFLRFVVINTLNGDFIRLKEALIGVEVYGRDPSYNPKTSPIVRTQAHRLRALLDEYYTTDGCSDRVIIRIPKGSYVAQFEFREPALGTTPLREESLPPLAAPLELIQEAPLLQTVITMPPVLPRQPFRWLLWSGVATALAALAILFPLQSREEGWKSVRFTNLPRYQNYPAISPDGKKVAYSWDGSTHSLSHIYVQDLRNQARTQLTFGDAAQIRPAWSPDGKELAYVEMVEQSPVAVYRIPSQGGLKREVTEIAGHDPEFCNRPRLDWSPDGQMLATAEPDEQKHVCTIIVTSLRTGTKRRITFPDKGVLADNEAAFSPDGKSIAFIRHAGISSEIYTVATGGGAVQQATSHNHKIIGFTWMPDGRSFVAASERAGDFRNIWQLFLDGDAHPLTNGPLYLSYPVTSHNGKLIAYVEENEDANIWRFNGHENKPLFASANWQLSPRYSPDGKRIAFCSNRTGTLEIWVADADGRNEFRVTSFTTASSGSPVWSPDGRQLAFDVRADEPSRIYRAEAVPNSHAVKVTSEAGEDIMPSWSPDGQYIYFASNRDGDWKIYCKRLSDGMMEAVTGKGGFRSSISDDGRYLYFTKRFPENGIWKQDLITKGRDQCVLPWFPARHWADWELRGNDLYYLSRQADGPSAIQSFNVVTFETRRLGETAGVPTTDGFSASPNGKDFTYVQSDKEGSNIFLLVQGK